MGGVDACRNRQCVSQIIECVPKHLMGSSDGLTQYNSFFVCGNIFFRRLCTNLVEISNLLQQFIKYGTTAVKDPNSVVGLPFAMAKLSCEKELFNILKKQDLLNKALELCLSILEKRPERVRLIFVRYYSFLLHLLIQCSYMYIHCLLPLVDRPAVFTRSLVSASSRAL